MSTGQMIKLFRQIIKFGIVGVICFFIDYGLLIFLTKVFGVYYLVSAAISFTVSVIVNYKLSMKYVFRGKDDISRRTEFIIFVVLSVIGLGLNEIFMIKDRQEFEFRLNMARGWMLDRENQRMEDDLLDRV